MMSPAECCRCPRDAPPPGSPRWSGRPPDTRTSRHAKTSGVSNGSRRCLAGCSVSAPVPDLANGLWCEVNMTDEKLKIGLLIPYLRDGGVERSMINLADGLIELGHSADLIVCAGGLDGPLAGEIPAGAGRVALGAKSAYGASLRLAAYVAEKRPWALLAAL